MIQVAQATLKAQQVSTGQYEYVEASAESLPFLEDSWLLLVRVLGRRNLSFCL